MNLKQALTLAAEKLAPLQDIDNPKLEAEILLKNVLQIDRARLHLELNNPLAPDKENQFRQWIERRLCGEPTAYIIGHREFFGLDFEVDTRVLIPRPETEILVEETLRLVRSRPVKSIIDIGTGSGAIAISLAVNLHHPSEQSSKSTEAVSKIKIYATDISPEALELAAQNARKLGADKDIIFCQGDLLNSLPEPVDIVIANLPYVTQAEVDRMPSAKYEPRLALDGGKDGLDQVFRISSQLKDKINPGGYALLEIGMGQSRIVAERLRGLFPTAQIEILNDLAGIERVVKIRV